MKPQSDQAIQSYLMKMSDVINQSSSRSQIVKSRGFSKLAQSINKFQSERPASSPSDLESESLEKVNYYIDLALNTFQSIQTPLMDEEQQSNFLFALSQTFETLGNYDGAVRNYEKVLATLKDQDSMGQIQYRMGRIYAERGKWEKAHELLNGTIKTWQAGNNDGEIALAQVELAKISYRKGDYLKAQEIFQTALENSERVDDIRTRATVSNHLGVIHRILGDYDLAYNHFYEALVEFQSKQDFRGAAETMNNLGVMHLRRCEMQQAQTYFDKSHQLCHEIGYFALLAFIYLNKAEYYCELGDGPMAANICHQALEYIIRLRNPIGIAKINMLFGRIFWKSADFNTAEHFYKTSIASYKEFNIPLGLANCYREYAQMLKESGRVEAARNFESKADGIYSKLNLKTENNES